MSQKTMRATKREKITQDKIRIYFKFSSFQFKNKYNKTFREYIQELENKVEKRPNFMTEIKVRMAKTAVIVCYNTIQSN